MFRLPTSEKERAESERSLYDQFLEIVEPPFLKAVLESVEGNRFLASDSLGIHRATLRDRLKRYDID